MAEFLERVFVPQRTKLLAYRNDTVQSAQVDSDGYMAQMIASIVIGVPGNSRRGKTGSHLGDLLDGTEVKSAYRIEQMNGKEDSHVNFGQISRQRMQDFLDRDRAIIVHTSYDQAGRPKIEVLRLDLRNAHTRKSIGRFLERSKADRPQLQPRLYPDGCRDRLQDRPGHFLDLGARLLARAVVTGNAVEVDKWSPIEGLDLTACLDFTPPASPVDIHHRISDPRDPDEFFVECMVKHRRALEPFAAVTKSTQNVGYANLAQHLVSVVTGIPGTGSGARGSDLAGNSEIKLAMGSRGDDLGTEDVPRLNLQSNVEKMLAWQALYPVRIILDDAGLRAKVLRADIEVFRRQVRDYFGPGSRFRNSPNLQYHVPPDFDLHVFTGLDGRGQPRLLECELLYAASESAFPTP